MQVAIVADEEATVVVERAAVIMASTTNRDMISGSADPFTAV